MKTILLPALLLSLLAGPGCRHLDFVPYVGAQQTWRIGKGAFPISRDGILIYRGVPERPYRVLGRILEDNINMGDLVNTAKAQHAEAVLVMNVQDINNGVTHYPGMTLNGKGWSYTLPSTTRPNVTHVTEAWFIRFESDDTQAGKLLSFLDWLNQHPDGYDGKGAAGPTPYTAAELATVRALVIKDIHGRTNAPSK